MTGPSDRRGGWRIEFGSGGQRRPGGPGGPRGPRGPLRPTGGGGDGDEDDPRGPIRPPLSPRARRIALGILVALLLIVAIFFRPLLHTPLMWIWRTPLPWIAAIIVLLVGRLLGNRAKLTVADLQAGRYPGRGLWASSFAVAGLVFFVLQAVNPILVERSLAKHTTFEKVDGLPTVGKVRLVPREVANTTLNGRLSSSIEHLTDLSVINTKEGLQWSAIRTPQGLVRRYTKKSDGFLLLNAENVSANTTRVDQEFKFAPGLAIFDSLQWQLRKRNLLVDLTAPVGILDLQGKPLILVPYLKYVGFPIRRPKLGGAFLVHPDGRIEDLSPEEAQKRPEIAGSGRLYPDSLARRVHNSYALRGGIWNYLFLHNDQTKIVDTEANAQPYLLQGPNDTTDWVSTAEPYGSGQGTDAIFITNSTTGQTAVWQVPEKQSVTGNVKALSAARAKPINGVTYGSADPRVISGGGYSVVEPRPVTIKDRLYFVVSVVQEGATNTTATVFVDTTNSSAVAVCFRDEATANFLKYGPAADADNSGQATSDQDTCNSASPSETTGDEPAGTTPDSPTTTTPSSSGGGGKNATNAELRKKIDAAIKQQQQAIENLKELQQELGTTP
jgi:hypothetical protein